MKHSRGFTLLELIIVIIIVGILATLGFVQYAAVIEKGRRAEAASILGTIRSMAVVWNQEGGHGTNYPTDTYLSGDLALPTAACAGTHYFRYTMEAGDSGTAIATRCIADGKTPQASAVYTMTLGINGTKSSDPTW